MKPGRTAIILAVIAVFFLLDRALKLASAAIGRAIPLADPILIFQAERNPGIAFSWILPTASIIALSLIIICALAFAAGRAFRQGSPSACAWVMAIAGAVSNLYDRLTYGYVVDYLSLFGISTANAADALILTGMIWLVADYYKRSKIISINHNEKNMPEITFTDANFENEALGASEPVLVDCYADWCGPCKMQGPIVEELAAEMSGKAKIGKLNVDQNPAIAEKYGVMSIPTILLIKGGEVKQTLVGLQGKETLKAELAKLA